MKIFSCFTYDKSKTLDDYYENEIELPMNSTPIDRTSEPLTPRNNSPLLLYLARVIFRL